MDSVPPTPPPSTAVMPAVAIAPAGTAVLPPSRPATSAALHTPSVSGKMALTPTHSHGSVQEPYQHKRTKVPAPRRVAVLCAARTGWRTMSSWNRANE